MPEKLRPPPEVGLIDAWALRQDPREDSRKEPLEELSQKLFSVATTSEASRAA
jgi:hypothetical protein